MKQKDSLIPEYPQEAIINTSGISVGPFTKKSANLIRRCTKVALMSAIISASVIGCDQREDIKKEDSKVEVINNVPNLSLSRPTRKDQLEHFSLGLLFATKRKFKFVVTSLDYPADKVTITSELKEVQNFHRQFQNPAPTGFKVEAFDMEGNPVPIDGTRKEGTIFGPDIFDGEPFNELD